MAKSALLKSSLAKKYWMSLTGLFLCLFLVIHLAGNLQLLAGAKGQAAFNEYTAFMVGFLPIKIASYLTYFSILFHAVDGILILSLQNKKARPVSYAYNQPGKNSMWASRNMGVLGTAILVFIVIHMGNFWFKYKFTELSVDAMGNKDMYSIVVASFKSWWYTGVYVLSMAALAFHLYHGFWSAFQTLGLHHRYSRFLKKAGYAFAIVIPAAFAFIPLYIFLVNTL